MSALKSQAHTILEEHRPDLGPYEELYRHFHANPELSDQESETAAHIAEHLKKLSSDLEIKTGIGGHGLYAILRNGEGRKVALRADFDGLPLPEKTGLEFASKKEMKDAEGNTRPVMHACGHDFHITCLLAAIETFIASKDSWSGTLIFLFQPAEERGTGAQAMVDDGLYDEKRHNCPIPDIVLGQHVMPLKAGHVGTKVGKLMSAADSFKVTIHGSGGHGSMPHRCVDPVVIASHCVVRLQTIVSREVPPSETAVVTVGAFQAGYAENVISHEAIIKLDIRSMTPQWRKKILDSVKRIVRAECEAGNSPREPTFERTREFPLTDNDPELHSIIAESFDQYFGDKHDSDVPTALGSEDFSNFARAVNKPFYFWVFGGHDEKKWVELEKEGRLDELPVNHSPYFAPALQPTLTTGVDAMVVAALAALKIKD